MLGRSSVSHRRHISEGNAFAAPQLLLRHKVTAKRQYPSIDLFVRQNQHDKLNTLRCVFISFQYLYLVLTIDNVLFFQSHRTKKFSSILFSPLCIRYLSTGNQSAICDFKRALFTLECDPRAHHGCDHFLH